jgi:dTDP-4-amino-4,6-dideoxygalactose transaminase
MPEIGRPPIRIPVLVPDLPDAQALLPWLSKIDTALQYTNFGPLVQEFERSLSSVWDTVTESVHVVSTNSGTAALELCVAALALPARSSVLVPAFTFPATATAVLRSGLVPIFADVAIDTWQLTPETALAVSRKHKLSLVVPVAAFGCPVDVAGWDAFVVETGIPVLIDAAAAFGNQEIGRYTHVAFSFHATKPFGIGEGGALVTRDAAMASRTRKLSNFGFEADLVLTVGANAKLSEYAAAVALAQWARQPTQLSNRRRLWCEYSGAVSNISGCRLQRGFGPDQLPGALVVMLASPAQEVAAALMLSGIQTRRWYYPPLHCHPAFARLTRCGPEGEDCLPVTEHLAQHTLGLPWFAAMSPMQCLSVSDALDVALDVSLGNVESVI